MVRQFYSNKAVFLASLIVLIIAIRPNFPSFGLGILSAPWLFLQTAALFLGLYIFRPRSTVHLNLFTISYAIFLAYTVLSSLWSPAGFGGFAQSVVSISVALFAVFVTNSLDADEILSLFFNSLIVFVGLSYVAIFLVPIVGVESFWLNLGDWRGLAYQKNGFGFICALLALMSAHNLIKKIRVALSSVALALTSIAVLFADSDGAILVLALSSIVYFSLMITGRLRLLTLHGVRVLLLSAALVAPFLIEIYRGELRVAGLVVDTSSRARIWDYALSQIQEGQRLLGTGIDGFWGGETSEWFFKQHGWVLENFHSSYISIFLQFGFVGITLFISALIIFILSVNTEGRYGSAKTLFISLSLAYIVALLFEDYVGRSLLINNIVFLTFASSALNTDRIGRALKRGGAHWTESVQLRSQI